MITPEATRLTPHQRDRLPRGLSCPRIARSPDELRACTVGAENELQGIISAGINHAKRLELAKKGGAINLDAVQKNLARLQSRIRTLMRYYAHIESQSLTLKRNFGTQSKAAEELGAIIAIATDTQKMLTNAHDSLGRGLRA